MARTYLITGANTGVGLAVVEQLMRDPNAIIYLGCLSFENGERVKHKQLHDASNVHVVEIDVTKPETLSAAANKIQHLDVLIANAGINVKGNSSLAHCKQTFEVNYYGVQRTVNAFLPLLEKQKGSRIVIVSSESGTWTHNIATGEFRELIDHPEKLTVDDVNHEVKQLFHEVAMGKFVRYPNPSAPSTFGFYSVSKMFLSTYARVLARELRSRGIIVTIVCPGYCATALNNFIGYRSVEQGAKSILQGLDTDKEGSFTQDGRELPFAQPAWTGIPAEHQSPM